MAYLLRALVALLEEQGSVLSTHRTDSLQSSASEFPVILKPLRHKIYRCAQMHI